MKRNYLHKDFVKCNYVLKSEVSAINALADIGEEKTVNVAPEKTTQQLFDKLSNIYREENKHLYVLDNSPNLDTKIKLNAPTNNRPCNYIKVSSLLNSYRSFHQSNKQSQWFIRIMDLMNQDVNVAIDLIIQFLFKNRTSELVNTLR